ncbi:hypothetical protein AB0M39_40215, partial [Streptomyces sp. NPDC051907]|uniref:hypothetical protein n=1 Tax=Streptomyces sp. NPDC051907 TaxID=3155284 RepID=UPI0034224CD0
VGLSGRGWWSGWSNSRCAVGLSAAISDRSYPAEAGLPGQPQPGTPPNLGGLFSSGGRVRTLAHATPSDPAARPGGHPADMLQQWTARATAQG